jgi:hypothetical protein
MDKLDEAIRKVLMECPDKISTPDLAILIANIVNVYGFEHLWPMVVFETTNLLKENNAVQDADDFMDKITKNKMH